MKIARGVLVGIALWLAGATRSDAACRGDCDGNARITIEELVLGVNIALGNRSIGDCEAFDDGGDGVVSVSELIGAVRNAIDGCPMSELQPFELASAADFDFDPALGIEVSRRHLYVMFESELSEDRLRTVTEASGGRPAGTIPAAGIVQVVLPEDSDVDDLEDAYARLVAMAGVSTVSRDTSLDQTVARRSRPIPSAAVDWDYDRQLIGPSWGLEAINAPQAWNLVDHIRRSGVAPVDVLVTDYDLFPHDDLAGILLNAPCANLAAVGMPGCSASHGTTVAGIIGASWDNDVFVEGVSPFVKIRSYLPHAFVSINDKLSFGKILNDLSLIYAARPPRVVNHSLGYNWYKECPSSSLTGQRCDPRLVGRVSDGSSCDLAQVRGEIAAEAVILAGALQHAPSEVLVVAAAGNDSGTELTFPEDYCASERLGLPLPPRGLLDFPAALGSPFNWAALQDKYPGIIVVEALTLDNMQGDLDLPVRAVRAPYSDLSGHVFAPADDMGALFVSAAGYGTSLTRPGTSFAAPMVAGAAAYLLAIEPSLRNEELVQLLTQPPYAAFQEGGNSATRVRLDLFSAALGIDDLRPNRMTPVRTWLADIDDGSMDGFERVYYADDGSIAAEAMGDARGSGKVDLRDFRRLRDTAWMMQTGSTLDASPTHPKLDLNFDGVVRAPAVEFYPRAGMTSAAIISPNGGLVQGMLRRDVEVFADAYEGDAVQAFDRSELEGLMKSADLIVRARDAINALGATAIEVNLRGTDLDGSGVTFGHMGVSGLRLNTSETVLTTPFRGAANVEWRPVCTGIPPGNWIVHPVGNLDTGDDRVVVFDRTTAEPCTPTITLKLEPETSNLLPGGSVELRAVVTGIVPQPTVFEWFVNDPGYGDRVFADGTRNPIGFFLSVQPTVTYTAHGRADILARFYGGRRPGMSRWGGASVQVKLMPRLPGSNPPIPSGGPTIASASARIDIGYPASCDPCNDGFERSLVNSQCSMPPGAVSRFHQVTELPEGNLDLNEVYESLRVFQGCETFVRHATTCRGPMGRCPAEVDETSIGSGVPGSAPSCRGTATQCVRLIPDGSSANWDPSPTVRADYSCTGCGNACLHQYWQRAACVPYEDTAGARQCAYIPPESPQNCPP